MTVTSLFIHLFNMSITATWIALAVMALRLVLKRTRVPKALLWVLWVLVAARLLLPFSVASALSLVPSRETVPPTILIDDTPAIHSGIPAVNNTLNPIIKENLSPVLWESINPMQVVWTVASWVWIGDMILMVLYAAVSYLRLRRRVRVSVEAEPKVMLCDGIDTPFILGIIRPRIYLPSSLSDTAVPSVLSHERAHLARRDHLWKPLGFALLTLHWFNPLLWVAYLLLCRDIESACDEKVVRDMDNTQKDGYSRALLACSMQGAFHRGWISACPVAFGETGVKTRIKSVLHYKKPAFWVLLIAILACVAVGVFFLTDPAKEENGESSVESSEESREESISEPSEEESSATESSEPEESYTVEGVYGDGVELLSREVVEYSEGALYRYTEYAVAVDGEILYDSEQRMQIREEYGYLRVLGNESNALLTLQGEEIFPLGMYGFIDITGEWLTGKIPEGGSVIYRLQEGEWKEKRRSFTRWYHFDTYCNGVAQFSSTEGTLLLGKYETVETGMPYWEVMDRYQEKFEAFIDDFYQTLRSCSEDDYEALLPYLPMYAEEMLPATEIPSYERPLDLRGYEMLRWLLKYSHYLSESCYIEEWDAACEEWGGSTIASLEFRCGEYDLWPSLRFTAKSDGTFYVSGFNGNLV